jgi:hypothetical protein
VPKPLSHQKANCISHEETTFEITNKSWIAVQYTFIHAFIPFLKFVTGNPSLCSHFPLFFF